MTDSTIIAEALDLLYQTTFQKLRDAQDNYKHRLEQELRVKLLEVGDVINRHGNRDCGCGVNEICSSCNPEQYYADPHADNY